MNTSKRQLNALTGIRFFLAIWVVIYHEGDSLLRAIGGPVALQQVLASFVQTGYAAVSAFFVLSGFVLTYNYDLEKLQQRRNVVRFGIARFSRIYPAYLAGLFLMVPFALYRMVQGIDAGTSADSMGFVLSVFLLQAWVPPVALSWNYPGWSLSNEAFFYATLPLTGSSIARLAKVAGAFAVRRLLVLGGGLWALSLVLPLIAVWLPISLFGDRSAIQVEQVRETTLWVNVIRYGPLVRLPEFCMGVVLGLLYRQLPADSRLWNRGWLFYLPAIVLMLAALLSAGWIPYPLLHNGLLAPVYAAMFFGLALEGGALVKLLSFRPLVFLGSASYTMYILHAPLGAWMKLFFTRGLKTLPEGVPWVICYLAVVIGVSAVIFKMVEEPVHQRLRAQLNLWAQGPERKTEVTSK